MEAPTEDQELVKFISQQPKPGKIHAAMVAVMKSVEAIAKEKRNQQQGFIYRGIDDVYGELHQRFSEAGIYCRPEVIKREQKERPSKSGGVIYSVTMQMRYHLVADDGSSVALEVIGEGMDSADKATNKAMAIAHKYALLQAFMIPTEDMTDPDATTPEPTQPTEATPQPGLPKPKIPKKAPAPPGAVHDKTTWHDQYIIDSDEKSGSGDKGPWTLWKFVLANGVEVKTFKDAVAAKALTLVDDTGSTPVDIEVGPGRKEGDIMLLSVSQADDIPH